MLKENALEQGIGAASSAVVKMGIYGYYGGGKRNPTIYRRLQIQRKWPSDTSVAEAVTVGLSFNMVFV